MPVKLAVVEILLVLLALPLSYIMARWMKVLSRPDYREDVQTHFLREWNGRAEDEYYAWLRLRNRYRILDSLPEHLTYIQQQIDECQKREMLSGFCINKRGQIVENISNPDISKILAE